MENTNKSNRKNIAIGILKESVTLLNTIKKNPTQGFDLIFTGDFITVDHIILCDLIPLLPTPVRAFYFMENNLLSTAIFSCCAKRYILPNARISLKEHPGTVRVDPQQLIREPDLRAHTEEKKEINDQLIRILAKNTGKSEEEIRIRIKKNPVMSAEEAIEFGIADEIFTDMNIFISSDSPNEENP